MTDNFPNLPGVDFEDEAGRILTVVPAASEGLPKTTPVLRLTIGSEVVELLPLHAASLAATLTTGSALLMGNIEAAERAMSASLVVSLLSEGESAAYNSEDEPEALTA